MWKGTWTAEERGSEEFWESKGRGAGRGRLALSLSCSVYMQADGVLARGSIVTVILSRRGKKVVGREAREGEDGFERVERKGGVFGDLPQTTMVSSQAYQDETDVFTRPTEEQIR